MATYGWVTDTEADTYFATRLDADNYWSSGTDKAAALTTAYYDILDSALFDLPSTATDAMKRAQYEQALFRLMGGEGVDFRAALQTQNVVVAGLMKETYRKGDGTWVPLAPKVMDLLDTYRSRGGVAVIELQRDRDEENIFDP